MNCLKNDKGFNDPLLKLSAPWSPSCDRAVMHTRVGCHCLGRRPCWLPVITSPALLPEGYESCEQTMQGTSSAIRPESKEMSLSLWKYHFKSLRKQLIIKSLQLETNLPEDFTNPARIFWFLMHMASDSWRYLRIVMHVRKQIVKKENTHWRRYRINFNNKILFSQIKTHLV